MNTEAVVKEFMKDYGGNRVKMFDSPCIAPDDFVTLYKGDDGYVRYCEHHDYMELLGVEPEVYDKIFKQYGY